MSPDNQLAHANPEIPKPPFFHIYTDDQEWAAVLYSSISYIPEMAIFERSSWKNFNSSLFQSGFGNQDIVLIQPPLGQIGHALRTISSLRAANPSLAIVSFLPPWRTKDAATLMDVSDLDCRNVNYDKRSTMGQIRGIIGNTRRQRLTL